MVAFFLTTTFELETSQSVTIPEDILQPALGDTELRYNKIFVVDLIFISYVTGKIKELQKLGVSKTHDLKIEHLNLSKVSIN